jgi:hypothetical protein
MVGVFDTLIQLRTGVPETQDITEVEHSIRALYPPGSSCPSFQLADVVERDGSKFVRLSTMAGSMHFMLRRGVKLKSFPRLLLCSTDREVGHYEYFS